MDTIVVGIDRSKGALSAVRWAASELGGVGVRAVYVVPRTELWSLSAVQVDLDKVLAEFRVLLDGRWTAPLRKAGVEYTTQLVRGDPAPELLRIATRSRATMLVVGSKSHNALADLIVGGTVHKVINRSTIPIVLVRPRRRRHPRHRRREQFRRFASCARFGESRLPSSRSFPKLPDRFGVSTGHKTDRC